jgi:beta-phosphoglucomutase family hydrolase
VSPLGPVKLNQTNISSPASPGNKPSNNSGATLRANHSRAYRWIGAHGRTKTANFTLNRYSEFDAVIFDMDGVITDTASVHAAAWKQTFDTYLRGRKGPSRQPFMEFTAADYLAYVDGRPRYKGVKAFLESRGIHLELGSSDDAPDQETVCGLGNRKNSVFNRLLEDGVKTFDSSVALVKDLRRNGIKVGLATSSKNAAAILIATRTTDLFDTVVDGNVSEKLGLKGKPEPDIFTTASDNLRVPYGRAVVVEDASTGVQAGVAGGFALVIGVARANNAGELYDHGADVVVADLAVASVEQIGRWVQAKRSRGTFQARGDPGRKGSP